jgi:D-3-phosphoglycerate dehydrogenase / 2-oxoglutarate reductase
LFSDIVVSEYLHYNLQKASEELKSLDNKYLIIDFDSTLVSVEGLEVLADIVLRARDDRVEVLADIKRICDLGMAGKVTFEQSLRSRLKHFSPNQTQLDELNARLLEKITPSVLAHKDFLKSNADNVYVVSGGFTEWINPVVSELGLKQSNVIANSFVFDDSGCMAGIDEDCRILNDKGKARAVEALSLNGEVYAIGDGYTDYEIKSEGAANKFILFTENVTRTDMIDFADDIANSFSRVIELVS